MNGPAATLATTHAALITRTRRGRHGALETDARWVEAMAEHEQLMLALGRRDGSRAGPIMLEHDLHTRDASMAQREAAQAGSPVGRAVVGP